MRRLFVALIIAVLAFTLAGCGGGAEPPAEETPPADGAAAPTAPPATEDPATVDKSPTEGGYPAPFPSFAETGTPAVIQTKLDAKRPMLIFFFDGRQDVTKEQRAEVDAVIGQYRGLIDLVTFDVGAASAAEAEAANVYARELAVAGTPYIITVDDGAFVTWRWRGYVERGVIGREVERATQ